MEALHAVIDRFEEEWAVLLTDDEQQLIVPRAQLPEGARQGDALVLSLGESGSARARREADGSVVLEDGQSLAWPGKPGADEPDAEAAGETWLALALDSEDTAARRGRVQGLLRDLFGDEPAES